MAGDLHTRIRAAIDADEAVGLLQRAIRTPSVTGTEAAFGALVADELRRLGCEDVTVEDCLPGRPVVWGVRRGKGRGPRLMVLGHLDTVHVRGWAEHWAGDARQDPFSAVIVDGEIWGRGSGDLKAGICTGLSALATLDRAGCVLDGDVVFVFIADEESGEPGTGVSAGIKAVVPKIQRGEIPNADFAIYVEPTRLAVFPAQIGFFITEITVTGRSAYFGMPEKGVDALKAGHAILSALWCHSAELESHGIHELIGRGFLLVTGMEAGGYIAVPERCSLSLIRKLRPGEDLGRAKEELEAVIRGAVTDPEVTVDIAFPAGRDHPVGGMPFETDAAAAPVVLLQEAVRAAMPGRGGIEGAPFWSEGSFTANQLGIPTVYCAPGDISNCHTFQERVPVAEYLAGVEAFALFMARFCSWKG
ncbi:M20 family metallopeptidase [Inquilinus limosus]|uniref:Acetylornithine deacetylase n=1 Tax=Inquilinus limosus MP06 TaxID=1398085 RepID=A0A0A0D9J3_9PROT|nr:M20/M25/M40 family metallo-hydrolase [Inquilinus limosus]KGM35351.1 acetylornithine deacetylase [Inquilinus limosus MP06]